MDAKLKAKDDVLASLIEHMQSRKVDKLRAKSPKALLAKPAEEEVSALAEQSEEPAEVPEAEEELSEEDKAKLLEMLSKMEE